MHCKHMAYLLSRFQSGFPKEDSAYDLYMDLPIGIPIELAMIRHMFFKSFILSETVSIWMHSIISTTSN